MKTDIFFGFVLCFITAVSSQRPQYLGNQQYLVGDVSQRSPELFDRNVPSFNKRPQANRDTSSETSQYRPPSQQEIANSQSLNQFQSNKNPTGVNQQTSPSFIYPGDSVKVPVKLSNRPLNNQPQRPSLNDDTLPTQNTGYINPIPKDRDITDEYRGYGAVTNFALNLFKASNSEENYVISPLSPQILLSYLAWVANGRTRNELTQACGYGNPFEMQNLVSSLLSEGSKREIQLATAFFISPEMRLNQQFLDRSVNSADVVPVNFKQPQLASKIISKWAKSKTKGGLKLNEISYAPSTKIALTSAIYFKGKFVYTFQPAQPGTFYTPQGPVPTQMMYMKKKFRAGNMGNYARWAAIPYESNDALVIILPNENVNIDIAMKQITERDLNEVLSGLESENTKANVNLTMPKFRLESTTNLIDPLRKMGVSTLFSPSAELPYLSDYQDVEVSNAQQQASLDVSEDGTVLIAFTNLNVVALSFQAPVPDVEFNVNRPFIAMIAETRRGFPYVFAKVTNPSK